MLNTCSLGLTTYLNHGQDRWILTESYISFYCKLSMDRMTKKKLKENHASFLF